MNNTNLAPIIIFVYKRADHTKGLMDSLIRCDLAGDTDVYIFSDGAKGESDSEGVKAVRQLIHSAEYEGAFKSLTIKEKSQNTGLAASIIAGVTEVMELHGKAIVLEDDLVAAKSLIRYMNQALDFYKDDEKIFSVAAWNYPLKGLKSYSLDAWVYYRACSWGWGMWKDKWDKVIFDPDKAHFESKLQDKQWYDNFCRGGNDLPAMLRLQLDKKIDSWAIRWNAWASELDMLTVYPAVTQVVNMGRDGSGTNCGADDSKQQELDKGKERYNFEGITLNGKLVKEAWRLDSETVEKKFRRKFKKIRSILHL